MHVSRGLLSCVITVLLAINLFVWQAVLARNTHDLRVSFLDIGQGDAILVQGPTGVQMLVDGGPDRSVLRQLPHAMGILDRSIDMIVETHPDRDHIGGLAGVFERYAVSYFMSPGIPNDTSSTLSLDDAVAGESGIHRFIARRGMRIHLGGGAYADVLYPDHDVSKLETNAGSVTMHIVYGKTSFMLSGDLPSEQEDYLVRLDAADGNLASDVLKAGHHGSKYSTDAAWLAAVHPSFVAISAGEGNSYGHPNPETVSRIQDEGARIFSTINSGTIDFFSDGAGIRVKTER